MTTDYVNGIEYEDGILNLIHMEDGRITKSGSSFTYEYFLKDHLGNVRSGFTSAAPTVASVRNDYYPFGLQYQSNILVGSPKNRYLYNGKELQDGNKLYDYGARLYDPVIGRWGKVDPLGENHFDKSPYNYVINNPMLYVDPLGLDTVDYNSLQAVMRGDDIRLADGSVSSNALGDVNVFARGRNKPGLSSYMVGVPVLESGFSSGEKLGRGDYLGAAADFGTAVAELATLGTGTALKAGFALASRGIVARTGGNAFRYMTEAELKAVQNTGLLRGGRAGETFFTKDLYKSAASAQSRLALPTAPTLRVEFQILNNPTLLRNSSKVLPANGMTGKGAEFMTLDHVKVKLINWQPLK